MSVITFTVIYIASVLTALVVLRLANKYEKFKELCLLCSESNYNTLVFGTFIPVWNTLVVGICLSSFLWGTSVFLLRKLPFSLSLVKLVKKIVE